VSPDNFYDWERHARSFTAMAIYTDQQATLVAGERAESIAGYAVSSSFFRVMGMGPEAGQWLAPEDDRAGGPNSVVLSNGLWRRSFGSDANAVGRTALFDGVSYTIVGVAPAALTFPEGADAWFSLALSERHRASTNRGAHWVTAVARLRKDVSVEQASAEIAGIEARLAKTYPRYVGGYTAEVTDLVAALVGPSSRRALQVLFGAVALLLLVACVNVSGLLMARAATRRTEMALRAALGAGRLALIRQSLVEGLVLATLAATGGVFAARAGVRALMAIVPTDLPRAGEAGLDLQVLLFAATLAVLSAVLFSLLPAVQSMTPNVQSSLSEARSDAGLGGSRRLRGALVAAEVALAMVLLVAAGLALRSFDRLTRVSPGFNPRQILTFWVSLPSGIYREDPQVSAFYQRLLERIDAIPGVVSSGAVMLPPVSTSGFGGTLTIDGKPETSGADEPRAQMRPVSPDYFRTLGTSIRRGRAFERQDTGDSLPVAIVSQTAARRFWPGEDPLGKRIRMHVSATGTREPFRAIVGVVSDIRTGPLQAPIPPVVYVPHAQHPSTVMSLMVRGGGDPGALAASVTAAVAETDRTVVPLDMEPLADHVATSRADWRFRAVLLALFAGSALFLALAGLYALVSYGTIQRRHEMGVRLVLGAMRRDIVRMVVVEGMQPVGIGLALGSAGSIALSRVMSGLLFGTQPIEPEVILAVALLFAVATTLACYVPARRAAESDPRQALRAE